MENLQDRRVLSHEESKEVWKQLQKRWDVDGNYWYPLRNNMAFSDVIAFEAEWFYFQIPLDMLHGIFKTHGITRIWEAREGGAIYEMDYELLEPYYDGEEGYWTSEDMDWLLYVSHESSLTVAGGWLVSAIKATWPHWQQHLWDGYDYKRPTRKTSH